MVLTEKEMATIEDLHTQELSCVEKYKRYGQEAKDPVLRDLFADLEKKEQKHVESLEQVMKGSVPSCNVNDRDGKMYEPKATYDSMTNPEDKKNDNFLATDSIGSEKMVSGTYNTDVFAFGDSDVRKLLADIQVEENRKRHGIAGMWSGCPKASTLFVFTKGLQKPDSTSYITRLL